ncbi:uncharacterized protein LOC129599074 [Paramacrobiotus metropolitanus]|uniref:uncharacterized protein LOC129599074 n=1 Tax=Paramacrobiotus metropolitanus TaxID=2943436 RepID=UPI0024461A3E|nr:uncharacterized protein LOC129599074 [Paramacrobiotus metropolitanus]
MIVDFRCRKQRAQFVEYGRLFHSIEPPSVWNASEDRIVQVLLRAACDGPWQWFPGELVLEGGLSFLGSVYLVTAQLPYGVIKELLPRQQVRRPPSDVDLLSRQVRPEEFQRRRFSVPRMTLVQQDEEEPFNAVAMPAAKRKHMVSGLPLQVELLAEVLQTLDSLKRTRCRRICALWNVLLTTELYHTDVRVSWRAEDCPRSWTHPRFWILAGLLHCVTRRTKVIVLMHMNFGEGDHAASMIRHLIGRVGTLVFYRCSWPYPGLTWDDTLYNHGSILRICSMADRAMWLQCRIEEKHLPSVVSQWAHSCQPQGELEVQLWNLFEKHIVVEAPVDRSILSEWIAHCIERGQLGTITEALYDYQTADPRPSNQYRRCRWTVSVIAGLDVNKLSLLAAAVMRCIMGKAQ